MNKMSIEKGHLAAEWRADGESEPGAKRRLRSALKWIMRAQLCRCGLNGMERTG